jgi:hypothetical protein
MQLANLTASAPTLCTAELGLATGGDLDPPPQPAASSANATTTTAQATATLSSVEFGNVP